MALLIDFLFHNGASFQLSISSIIFLTPSSKVICGFQSKSFLILLISAQVQSGSPGLFGKYSTLPFMEWLFDSIAFWVKIKTPTMRIGNNNPGNSPKNE